jgi:hypothetical protein
MARRAEVRKIEATIDKVWAGLLLFEDDDHPIRDAIGNPGDSGSTVIYGHGGGDQTHQVLESGHKHYVRYRCRFHGASAVVQHFAFTDATVEADYELKPSQDDKATFVRAVAEYQAPLWPTGIALMFALLSLLGMNAAGSASTFVMASLVGFWVVVGVAMQYLPRVFAYRFVTGPVLDHLAWQARNGSFNSSVTWRPSSEGLSLTGILDLRPMSKMNRASQSS